MHNLATAESFAPTSAIIAPVTDVHLVNRVREQNEDALIQLYQRYGALVYSIALRTLGDERDAEEVTQDVFLRIWEKGDQFDPARGTFTAWLATSTRNAAIDRLRKRQRRVPDEQIVYLDESPQLWETVHAETRDDELLGSMAEAISHLSTEQQQAISLAYFYGMSQSEIANRLQRPLGTVKSHIRQGMERLRQIWLSQET